MSMMSCLAGIFTQANRTFLSISSTSFQTYMPCVDKWLRMMRTRSRYNFSPTLLNKTILIWRIKLPKSSSSRGSAYLNSLIRCWSTLFSRNSKVYSKWRFCSKNRCMMDSSSNQVILLLEAYSNRSTTNFQILSLSQTVISRFLFKKNRSKK